MIKMTKKIRIIISCTLLITGITMMLLGILRGEAETVFEKAIRVCMECIGIG